MLKIKINYCLSISHLWFRCQLFETFSGDSLKLADKGGPLIGNSKK